MSIGLIIKIIQQPVFFFGISWYASSNLTTNHIYSTSLLTLSRWQIIWFKLLNFLFLSFWAAIDFHSFLLLMKINLGPAICSVCLILDCSCKHYSCSISKNEYMLVGCKSIYMCLCVYLFFYTHKVQKRCPVKMYTSITAFVN